MLDFSDMNVWGIFAMPVGLLLCFGPALVVWLKMEAAGDADTRRKSR